MLQLSKQAFALDFSGGSGTEEDPYLVSSLADYTYIDWEPNAYFKLTCDIEGVTYERGTFNGHLDGNNHYISVNMECRSASLDYGLFKEASGAVFKNITIKGVYTGLVSGRYPIVSTLAAFVPMPHRANSSTATMKQPLAHQQNLIATTATSAD